MTLADLLQTNDFYLQCFDARSNKSLFYQLINEEIVNWIVWAEQYKDRLCNAKEDDISFNLVTRLRARFPDFFEVSHDSHHGGHTDIHVRFGRFHWLGEAKLSSGSAYSLKGFHQLVDRYASGSPTCSEGGLLIYIVNESAKKKATNVLKEWQDYIQTESDEIEDLVFAPPHTDREGLNLVTQHTHSTSGLKYTVHHHLVQLQHFPTDNQ